MFAYVGSRTTLARNARGKGISIFRVDAKTGDLALVDVVGGLVNPSYLALRRDGTMLYTVHGDESEVSAFAVERSAGTLQFINRQSAGGRNPVHLALSPDERHLVVSNHLGASVAVLPIAADGALQPVSQLTPLSGPIGPHRIEQQQSKPHFNPFAPHGNLVYVPDKGLDRIFAFRFHQGTLRTAEVPFVATREGAGPRNMVFHPSLPTAYVVNELDSTMTAYRVDAATGRLDPLQVLSTLPDTFAGNSRAAGIAIDSAGRTLYASNRGHDSIAAYRIDAATGRLTLLEVVGTGGRTPRFFTLSPDGATLYALNEDSDGIAAFRVSGDGRLASPRPVADTGSPVCMVFSA